MSCIRLFFPCVAAALLLVACSVPPPLQKDDVPPLFASLFPEKKVKKVIAFGKVKVSIDGEMHSGSIEVRWNDSGEFSADFYAPLGIIIGSIKAAAGRGTVAFEAKEYAFTMAQTMDTLPFAWGRDLTFGDLLEILLAQMPAPYTSCLRSRPDSLSNERRTISALWKTDSCEIQAEIGRRSCTPESVKLVFKKHAPFWCLKIGSFEEFRAHKIELRENDRNYFSITYTKVKCD